jgi:hypothetical protein
MSQNQVKIIIHFITIVVIVIVIIEKLIIIIIIRLIINFHIKCKDSKNSV